MSKHQSFTHYSVKNYAQTPILNNQDDLSNNQFNESLNFIENLKNQMKMNIISLSDEEIIFDLIGIDASIANALRRIFLAEVNRIIALLDKI